MTISKLKLNIQNAAYRDGYYAIVVKSGKFFEYNLSNAANENPAANFIAEGYKVIAERKKTAPWYTVIPE